MKRFGREGAVLVILLAILAAIALSSASAPPSTYSSFDHGRNGYLALYNVLARTGIPVSRLEAPLGQMDSNSRVVVVTAPHPPAFGSQIPISFSAFDLKRLRAFLSRGGTILAFGTIRDLKKSKRLVAFDVTRYTNESLEEHPRNAVAVYDAIAGRGPAVFDEQIHGYDRTRSLWSVLPNPVRAGCWMALVALLLWLIDANIRYTPAIATEPPVDRDSSDYVISMARLLRRARAGHAAIARFAAAYPHDTQLATLAAQSTPGNDAVLAAAIRFSLLAKGTT